MSRLAQIEAALKALDPAGFQRLCDSYLYARGYENINPIGLVVGADKVLQGTPDSFLSQSDGRYIFAEYSTWQRGSVSKFKDDLAKCFNPEKTGIPVDRIREVILCHTFRLRPRKHYELAEMARSHGVLLLTFGLGQIAHDLYQKYPGLARDFLGVAVDTGQIVSVGEFIAAYHRNLLATPLNTAFQFRDDEIGQLLCLLESESLVLISGSPGVGKTRFALECCRRYSASHPKAQLWAIHNRGADLFEDLRVHFSAPGHYVIMVDDTNRVSGFRYVLQLLQDRRDDRAFKIVATVRDYALDTTLDATRSFGPSAPVKLLPLKEEEITKIVQTEFNIQNDLYLERIIAIAQGNPRLAIMAAVVVQREKTLRSIDDVTALYDAYFRSIRDDLGDFSDSTLLQVAGLIAFFRTIDRTNSELVRSINDAFGIDAKAFWRAAEHLHRAEAVDVYENEVVRVSDQVLSTYLFYLSVFQKGTLDFGILLEYFFPRFRHRLVDAINPVLGAFDKKLMLEKLGSYVDRSWSVMQRRGDTGDLAHLIDVFWFVKPTQALLYVQESIRSLEEEPRAVVDLTFTPGSQAVQPASILSILSNFRNASEGDRRIALALLVDYLEKRPAEMPLVIRMLTEHFGIDRHSYLPGFCVQRDVADILWEKAQGGANELVSRLFLVISEAFLQTHFTTHESKGNYTIVIHQFDVPATPELLVLRQTIWNRVFSLYSVPLLREPVLHSLQRVIQGQLRPTGRDVIAEEAAQIQAFFRMALEPGEYRHCVIVHAYLDMIQRVGAEVTEGLRAYFTNDAFALSELLIDDRNEQREMGWEEYQKLQRDRLIAYTAGFDAADLEGLFETCKEILAESVRNHYEYQVQAGVADVLLNLAQCDPALYETVLGTYLHAGNLLNLGPWGLAAKLIEVSGPKRAHEILSSGEYPGQGFWLFAYFSALTPEAATEERLEQLYRLYETAIASALWRDMDYLLKFGAADDAAIIRVTRTLVERAAIDPGFGRPLGSMFTKQSKLCAKLADVFAQEVSLLKKAYFAACAAGEHSDSEGHAFNLILDLDPGFGDEWVSWRYGEGEGHSRYYDSLDYSFIWRREDYASLITELIKTAFDKEDRPESLDSYLQVFFATRAEDPDAQALRDRQDSVLDNLIEQRRSDSDFMRMLFGVVRDLESDRRRARILRFLRLNQDFRAFDMLPLEPRSWSWSGSAVPMLQGRVEFLESLLPFLRTVDLLHHGQRIEQEIQYLREKIEREKRRDFMDD